MDPTNRLLVALGVVALLAVIFNLEFYKLDIFLQCYADGTQYPVFPESTTPQLSSSNPLWLYAHLVLALTTLTLAYLRLVHIPCKGDGTPPVYSSTVFNFLHGFCFVLFALVIAPNMHHFGTFSLPIALLANGGSLGVALYYFPWEASFIGDVELEFPDYLFHLLAITSPVVFEVVVRVVS